MKNCRAALLLIAYKRTEPLKHSLPALKHSIGLNDRPVFVYLDGPRSAADNAGISAVYQMFQDFKKVTCPRLEIVRREKNYGCRENIKQAISELINRFGQLIIVEDDVIVSHTFFQYIDEALDFYRDDKRIWGINAWRNRFVKIPRYYKEDVYLHQQNLCSGWGTWADRWNEVDFDMKSWPEIKSDPQELARVRSISQFLPSMLESQYKGELDSWAVSCCLHMIKKNLYCIEPRYSITKNYGGVGEHFSAEDTAMSTQPFYNFRPKLVAGLCPDAKIEESLGLSDFNPSLAIRIWRKILRNLWCLGPRNDNPQDLN